jgi:hypothetical protein
LTLADQLIYTPVRPKATINVALRLFGGKTTLQGNRESPLEILSNAPGGFINQVILPDDNPSDFWDTSSSLTFNVQLVDAKLCKIVLGRHPLLPPVTAFDYANPWYLPLYKIPGQVSGIFGNFPVKSVGQMDKATPFGKRNAEEHKLEENLTFGSKPVTGSIVKPKSRNLQRGYRNHSVPSSNGSHSKKR